MIRRIISNFVGLFTNADAEDIPKEYCTVLENLRPYNGELIKTFGFGEKVADNSKTLDNIFVFLSDKFSAGYLYIAVAISSNTVTLYGLDTTWKAIGDITEVTWSGDSYYSVDAKNPILASYDTVRFYPGAKGEHSGNTCEPIWLGYIDRTVLDGLLTVTANFYDESVFLKTPVNASADMTVSYEVLTTGPFSDGDVYYYRYAYIYDGEQESLLSEALKVTFEADSYVKFTAVLNTANYNKRITGIKLYRATAVTATFNLVELIDFTRTTDDYKSGNGGQIGRTHIYIPDLDGALALENSGVRIKIDGGAANVVTGGYSGTMDGILDLTDNVTSEKWNKSWEIELYIDTGPGGWDWVSQGVIDDGSYCGDGVVIAQADQGDGNLEDGVLVWDTAGTEKIRDIRNNYGKAIRYNGTVLTDDDKNWKAVYPGIGMYYMYDSGGNTTVTIEFFDKKYEAGLPAPYDINEISLMNNGEFVHSFQRRTWLANLVLDVGGRNELRPEWVMYSELNQPDALPASNTKFITKGHGKYTGMTDIGDYLVLLRETSIVVLDSSADKTDPTLWGERVVGKKIGNLAKHGYIDVLDRLYVPYNDGIYELSENHLARGDKTPLEKMRISEEINDTYLALTKAQKVAIQSAYNPDKTEIYFLLGSAIYAYNVIKPGWRTIVQTITVTAVCADEEDNVLIYNLSDKKVYSSGVDGSVAIKMRSKVFTNAREQHGTLNRNSVFKHLVVTYQSAENLTMKVFADNNTTTPIKTFTIASNSKVETVNLGVKARGEKFQVQIEASASSSAVKINKVKAIIG